MDQLTTISCGFESPLVSHTMIDDDIPRHSKSSIPSDGVSFEKCLNTQVDHHVEDI